VPAGSDKAINCRPRCGRPRRYDAKLQAKLRAISAPTGKFDSVTGQGKGNALPLDAALVAAASCPQDFHATMAAIVSGDKDALAQLYDSTVARVHGLVRAIVHNDADAEEVTCDVYTQIWQTAANFDSSRGSVMSWLLSIARSRALDCLRRQRSTLRIFKDAPAAADERAPEPTQHESPEHLLSAFQSHSMVRTALEQLSPERRRLVCMAFFDDLTHSEIAEVTGLPMGTIKSHLRRAIQSLRSVLYDSELA
jgi:RNA polymerase sigma factor (sigma-70 family)